MTVTAALGERVGNARIVEVQWTIVCNGASDPLYFGNLNLDDQGSGESIYLGGVSSASGTTGVPVSMESTPRTLKPRLNASCAGEDFHGSGTQEVFGNEVVVPALNCDPDLLEKALREYDTAASFYDAAVVTLQQAHEPSQTSLTELAKAKAKKKILKQGLKEAAILLGDDAVAIVKVGSFYIKIGSIIIVITFKVIPKIKDSRAAFKEAHGHMEDAEEWRLRAEADLAAALAAGPCTGELRGQLDQALDQQQKQEEARELIESWENNGYLYLNPATNELLDEKAALEQARRILAGGQSGARSRSAEPRDMKANRRQINAAIAKIEVAQRLTDRVQTRVRRADAAAQQLRRGLLELFP